MTVPAESRVRIVVGDISRLAVDAIVTAANQALAGGGGVDGAVHAAAGPELLKASRALAPCSPGNARITTGYDLQARFVIHAVGPMFRELEADSAILGSAYRSALELASKHHLRTLALPCISTGIYGFPKRPACEIAIDTVLKWLQDNALPEAVIFCCYTESDASMYVSRLKELGVISPAIRRPRLTS